MAQQHDTIGQLWRDDVVPALVDYVRIPALSPAFDADWQASGHIDAAVELVRAWCAARPVAGLQVEVVRLEGRTPLLVLEVPATPGAARPDATVLLYGHLDKQPEMVGWRPGLGPWTPVLDGERLYGRGGADDGYAAFAVLSALEALQRSGAGHGRCIALIEASEESGSPDLPAYVDALAGRIGRPELVVCLDSGCATWDRLWVTTSLRGNIVMTLRVDVLDEGIHSGSSGGVVPSSFRVLRHLLDRIEDSATGRVLLPELWVEVPEVRRAEMAATAAELGAELVAHLPLVDGVRPQVEGPEAVLRARTWEPSIAYTGADGFPSVAAGGNVLRPSTTLKMAVRLPPTCDSAAAAAALVRVLEADPPSGARVRVDVHAADQGWAAPAPEPWLAEALEEAGRRAFGREPRSIGEGGSIPFMAMLGARFPDAQFLVTGVLGPESNAHGPNEFLDLPMARGVTAVVADVLAAHARR